jgi:outer membrane protein TolC
MATLARRTPEYKRALASRQGAEEEVKVARSGFLPSFDLESSAGRSGDVDSFDDDRWSVGVKMTFPFWPGGKNVHEYGRAKANLAEAEATLLGTENTVVAELKQVLLDLRNSAEDVLVQKRLLQASETRAEISRVQYANGLLSFENWDIIENELIDRSKLLLDAQRAALIAEAAWWRESGMSAFRRAGRRSE